MISFDTNILIYSVDKPAGQRHARAADLVERAIRRGRCLQTLQSLCEFFYVATRKVGIDPQAAAAFVADWQTAAVVEAAALSDLADAMRAMRDHGLAFWEAMLWATARRAGVRLLVSEDFQDGRIIEGVRIVDPFAAGNIRLVEAALAG